MPTLVPITYNIYNNATGELIKSGATRETNGRIRDEVTNTETVIATGFGTFEISQGAISFVFADTAEGVELVLESGALTFDLNKSIGGSSNAELYVNMESGGGGTEMIYKLRINGKLAQISGKSKGTLTFNGKTYQWDNTVSGDTTDELLGTWVFNESVDIDFSDGAIFDITFNYDGTTGDTIKINKARPYNEIWYANADGTETAVYAYTTGDLTGEVIVPSGMSWLNEAYRTITITDTSILTNRDEFTTWLKANAVKQTGGGGN